ncbi:hypothetical protein CN378_17340 [Bacillus sp. AFS015802]|uniref:hypothetical protein n=1 Tax=Bacillus sp. AFS015802 TaxID=2033486 RepID=UPI000BFA9624|nr:hypothetical protein [Bacillus sp. AFS015802]PFA62808.1 hypothetical protein CN378_17340 [Bacillus sp. AFS015802]
MRRMPFERPTDYYNDKLLPIDEELCALLQKRKEISHNNPGYPKLEDIVKWAEKYDVYEDLLRSVFGVLENEEAFKPQIEPEEFQYYRRILQAVETEECIYTVPFIKQYSNASVVHLNIDREYDESLEKQRFHRNSFWHLEIGEGYDCRVTGGGGSQEHTSFDFIVTPPLPEDLSGLTLTFKEYGTPFQKKPTGVEVVFTLS